MHPLGDGFEVVMQVVNFAVLLVCLRLSRVVLHQPASPMEKKAMFCIATVCSILWYCFRDENL